MIAPMRSRFSVLVIALLAIGCSKSPEEQYNLGVMYTNGEGVPQDDVEAVKWYRLAADQGNAKAQFNLGVRYANGKGVPRNYVLAYAWINIVAANGAEKAKELKKRVSKIMTQEQIAEAQKLSREISREIEEKNN